MKQALRLVLSVIFADAFTLIIAKAVLDFVGHCDSAAASLALLLSHKSRLALGDLIKICEPQPAAPAALA